MIYHGAMQLTLIPFGPHSHAQFPVTCRRSFVGVCLLPSGIMPEECRKLSSTSTYLIHGRLCTRIWCPRLDASYSGDTTNVDDTAGSCVSVGSLQEVVTSASQCKHGQKVGAQHILNVLVRVVDGGLSNVCTDIVDCSRQAPRKA